MNESLTVSQFVEAVNYALDALEVMTVEGEVDEFKIIHNKWVTFSLKDRESSVNCFMTVWQYKAQIEDGMLVKAVGQPRLRNKGFFSFVLQSVQPAGEGALRPAFELLKQKLQTEGLFSPERKRQLPRFPQHIALITSQNAAAYTDFIKVLGARQGGLTVSFLQTQVQGEDAPRQIIEALNIANTELHNPDIIVLVRGGGSLEDLQAFNQEDVVRAVAASRTPTIVGIGHERDVTLAELAADVRASTPSNAAELAVRSRQEIVSDLRTIEGTLKSRVREAFQQQQKEINHAVSVLRARIQTTASQITRQVDSLHSFGKRLRQQIQARQERISTIPRYLTQRYMSQLQHSGERTTQLRRMMQSLSPEHTLRRGYSITRSKNGSIIKKSNQTSVGEELVTTLSDGNIRSTVDKIIKS